MSRPDPNFHTMPDEYSVVTNPGSQFNNGYNYFGDHTSDSGGMLFVDGTSSGAFWRQSVTLAANTTYSFTYYVTAADSESPGEIALSLNGSVVDAGFPDHRRGGRGKMAAGHRLVHQRRRRVLRVSPFRRQQRLGRQRLCCRRHRAQTDARPAGRQEPAYQREL